MSLYDVLDAEYDLGPDPSRASVGSNMGAREGEARWPGAAEWAQHEYALRAWKPGSSRAARDADAAMLGAVLVTQLAEAKKQIQQIEALNRVGRQDAEAAADMKNELNRMNQLLTSYRTQADELKKVSIDLQRETNVVMARYNGFEERFRIVNQNVAQNKVELQQRIDETKSESEKKINRMSEAEIRFNTKLNEEIGNREATNLLVTQQTNRIDTLVQKLTTLSQESDTWQKRFEKRLNDLEGKKTRLEASLSTTQQQLEEQKRQAELAQKRAEDEKARLEQQSAKQQQEAEERMRKQQKDAASQIAAEKKAAELALQKERERAEEERKQLEAQAEEARKQATSQFEQAQKETESLAKKAAEAIKSVAEKEAELKAQNQKMLEKETVDIQNAEITLYDITTKIGEIKDTHESVDAYGRALADIQKQIEKLNDLDDKTKREEYKFQDTRDKKITLTQGIKLAKVTAESKTSNLQTNKRSLEEKQDAEKKQIADATAAIKQEEKKLENLKAGEAKDQKALDTIKNVMINATAYVNAQYNQNSKLIEQKSPHLTQASEHLQLAKQSYDTHEKQLKGDIQTAETRLNRMSSSTNKDAPTLPGSGSSASSSGANPENQPPLNLIPPSASGQSAASAPDSSATPSNETPLQRLQRSRRLRKEAAATREKLKKDLNQSDS
jgi:hypothetical protein